jgi:hypothetical protein
VWGWGVVPLQIIADKENTEEHVMRMAVYLSEALKKVLKFARSFTALHVEICLCQQHLLVVVD